MKNGFVIGSAAALAAVAKLDTTVSFLLERRQAVALGPAGRRTGSAYVWRRVFLDRRQRRA
jgi:hypothetical protein